MITTTLVSRKEQPAALVITTSTPIITLCPPDPQRLSVRRQHTDVTLYMTQAITANAHDLIVFIHAYRRFLHPPFFTSHVTLTCSLCDNSHHTY